MYCHFCGKEISDFMKFCPHCGKALEIQAAPKSEESKNELYDVVVLDAGREKMNIIKEVRAQTGLSLSLATHAVNCGKLRIKKGLSLDAATSYAQELESKGVKVDIVESGSDCTTENINKGLDQNSSDKHKSLYRSSYLFGLIGSAAAFIACLLVAVLPIFTFSKGSISMLDFTLRMLKGFSFDEISLYVILDAMLLLSFVCVIAAAVRALIFAIGRLRCFINFEEHYATKILGMKPETVAEFLKNRKKTVKATSLLAEIIPEAYIFYFLSGAFSVSIPLLVVILAIFVFGIVADKISDAKKKAADKL